MPIDLWALDCLGIEGWKMLCPICNERANVVGAFKDTPILRCAASDCGFRFFDLSRWSSPYDGEDYYGSYVPTDLIVEPCTLARVASIRKFRADGRLAELGCGSGATALAFKEAGYDVTAVDESTQFTTFLSERYPEIAWVDSAIGRFLEGAPKAFDILTMFHVLEHIPEPRQVVEQLDGALRPGGIILIEVPDVGGGRARIQGKTWEYYLDHHINYFDTRSLKKLFGLHGYRAVGVQRTYHYGYPQGKAVDDAIRGALAWMGYNSIVRMVFQK